MTANVPQNLLHKTRRRLQEKLTIKDDSVSFWEWITIAVIIVYSIILGMTTYPLSADAMRLLEIINTATEIYFVVEISVRIFAELSVRDFFKNGWNTFDALVVAVSLIPLEDSEYVLLGRLLRLFLITRLIIFMPRLRELVLALLRTLPKVGYVALMMFILFYIYGVFGSLMFVDINPELWGNVGLAMITMFRIATLEDWTDVMYETMAHYPLSWIFYISFIVFITFIMLNMIVGVIVETILIREKIKSPEESEES